MPSPLRVHLALLTVSLVFGVNYVFTKEILAAVSPRAWVLFRLAAATCVMVPLALSLRRQRRWPPGRLWLGLAVASFFGVALNQVLFTEGIARTTPEHSAVVNAGIPTWTVIVAVIARQERLTARLVLAIVSALGGVLYLLGLDRLLAGEVVDRGGATLLGDLLTMANGLAFAVHLVIMRRIAKDLDAWQSTAILFASGTLMLGLWSGPFITAADVDGILAPRLLAFAAYAVLASTVLTYLLNTWALRHTHSSQVALYINVQPLVAAGLHTAMGAPPPGHRFAIALVLVAFGLWLQTRRR